VIEVSVFVQSCPARRENRRGTLESLRKSDVGDGFTLLEHPDGIPKCEFFEQVLGQMVDCHCEYVMRVEDDALVNRHILHNFLSWPALSDALFGAGWLYVSEAAFRDPWRTRTSHGQRYRSTEVMYGALCAAMPRSSAGAALKTLRAWKQEYGCAIDTCECDRRNKKARPKTFGQDAALSRSVWSLGKRVFFHEPALAENRMLPSTHGLRTTGHPSHWRAGKLFNPEWRRP
jgi:hypothetical protein